MKSTTCAGCGKKGWFTHPPQMMKLTIPKIIKKLEFLEKQGELFRREYFSERLFVYYHSVLWGFWIGDIQDDEFSKFFNKFNIEEAAAFILDSADQMERKNDNLWSST
ncbi:hypothetical protein [Paenibacillus sp. Leaf72]|uniref:hypothetical protein n=1 Tax=Paenibacillus sp. Leaf72 TaxID=1736234 RepID=UPI0012DFC18C|nr:hypothetical protein [Paenibacillus sp. Leaf72]